LKKHPDMIFTEKDERSLALARESVKPLSCSLAHVFWLNAYSAIVL
jgi:hypothetical protein